MKLKEFEAKQLLEKSEIPISKGVLITSIEKIPEITKKKIAKVQSLTGSRMKKDGIKFVESQEQITEFTKKFLNNVFEGETITEILLDEVIEIQQEIYIGIMFNTTLRKPILIYSEQGGIDIEQLKKDSPEKINIIEVDYIKGLDISTLNINQEIKDIIKKAYNCFVKYDCRMLEINPLAKTENNNNNNNNNNNYLALDAVIVLDDNANYRREISFPERTGKHKATKREITARKIDEEDHRGVAGKTFLDLDGDIGILTSGGGASMTLIDALTHAGGKPANYTEYSGNPPAEKVEKLTRIVLDKKNLSGLLIAGVIANFTDIAETMAGILNALKDIKPKFPIVIRRAGPNDKKVKEILMQAKKDFNLDIHYYDETIPLTKAAELIVELSNKYKQYGNINR